jgi:hypothetical protein
VNQFIKTVTNIGKKEYLYWIKIGCSCSLELKNNGRKNIEMGKKEFKN